ncbi:helix-turn-helix domain-containing protein [Aureimonas sp. N4]|uniref:helix-turn-helix domain-containing protein n=1 Tax=Aureimonas sp. N4 TaxID=1638165 RepID=UPI000B2D9657|nr:helix-turn-helix transcriptional regulator [Aureimonas sp. N4]
MLSPREWRKQMKLPLAGAASLAGVTGKNPGRTWQRWELGERQPPLSIILKIDALSGGRVSTASWLAAKQSFEARAR